MEYEELDQRRKPSLLAIASGEHAGQGAAAYGVEAERSRSQQPEHNGQIAGRKNQWRQADQLSVERQRHLEFIASVVYDDGFGGKSVGRPGRVSRGHL